MYVVGFRVRLVWIAHTVHLACVFGVFKRRSRSARGSRACSSTWFWTWRTTRSRISSGYSLSTCACLTGAVLLTTLVACRAQAFIDNALNMGGRVLVHCNGTCRIRITYVETVANRPPVGISLSPAFVVMYVMQRLQITWEDALHMVQNRRYCISPNGGFLTQIKVTISWRFPSMNNIFIGFRSTNRYTRQMSPSNNTRATQVRRLDEREKRAVTTRTQHGTSRPPSFQETQLISYRYSTEDRKRPLVEDEDVAMQM